MRLDQPRISRRELLLGRFRAAAQRTQRAVAPKDPTASDTPKVAVIQGRFCLAYRNLACSTCYERCPEPGAMRMDRGVPRVEPNACTGCGVCYDVCPAPRNAVLLCNTTRLHTEEAH